MTTLPEVVETALETFGERLFVGTLAAIVSYNTATGVASVQPLVARTSKSTIPERLPVIPSVPILMPGSSLAAVDWTPAPGDLVLLVCTDTDSLPAWFAGGPATPRTPGSHALSFAFGIPVSRVATRTAAVGVAVGPTADTSFATIVTKLNEIVTQLTSFAAHTHVCTAPGSPSGPPVPTLTLTAQSALSPCTSTTVRCTP